MYMRKRILILEDETKILELVEMILGEEGYDAVAINHYEPLDYIIDLAPELILLDVRLSSGYGHLLCKDIKADPITSGIPVVLISGSHNLEAIAKDCKADGFLSKPFSVEGLINTVKQFD